MSENCGPSPFRVPGGRVLQQVKKSIQNLRALIVLSYTAHTTQKENKCSMQVRTNARNNLQLLSEPRVVWGVSSKQLTSLRQTHWRTARSSVCWCVTWGGPSAVWSGKRWCETRRLPFAHVNDRKWRTMMKNGDSTQPPAFGMTRG